MFNEKKQSFDSFVGKWAFIFPIDGVFFCRSHFVKDCIVKNSVDLIEHPRENILYPWTSKIRNSVELIRPKGGYFIAMWTSKIRNSVKLIEHLREDTL